MSVGFVSVAAGVLLASHLLKCVHGQHISDKNSTFMTFAKPKYFTGHLERKVVVIAAPNYYRGGTNFGVKVVI